MKEIMKNTYLIEDVRSEHLRKFDIFTEEQKRMFDEDEIGNEIIRLINIGEFEYSYKNLIKLWIMSKIKQRDEEIEFLDNILWAQNYVNGKGADGIINRKYKIKQQKELYELMELLE